MSTSIAASMPVVGSIGSSPVVAIGGTNRGQMLSAAMPQLLLFANVSTLMLNQSVASILVPTHNSTSSTGNLSSLASIAPASSLMVNANQIDDTEAFSESDYDYDSDSQFLDGSNDTSAKDMIIILFTGLFYGTAFLLGAIGNSLIIYIVLNYTRMRTLCNVFLASLATADLLLVILCIPVKLIQLVTYTWTLGMFTCKALHYVQSVSAFCSVLTLTTMSIERYYAIIHPVECRTTFSMAHIKKIIVLVWTLAFIMAIPTTFVYIHVRVGQPTDAHYWCMKISSLWAENEQQAEEWTRYRRIFECYQLITILAIPALIMIYMYSRICVHLWSIMHGGGEGVRYGRVRQTKKLPRNGQCVILAEGGLNQAQQQQPKNENSVASAATKHQIPCPANENAPKTGSTSSHSSDSSASSGLTMSRYRLSYQQKTIEEDNATVKQVIKMLVAVVVFFILCWSPIITINVLRSFEWINETNEGYLKEAVTVAYLLAYLNSVINPFVYGLMSKNFRHYFFDAMHDILGKLTPKSVRRRAKGRSASNGNNGVMTANQGVRRSVPNNNPGDDHFALRDHHHYHNYHNNHTLTNTRTSSNSPPIKRDARVRVCSRMSIHDKALEEELGLSVIVLETENDSCQLDTD